MTSTRLPLSRLRPGSSAVCDLRLVGGFLAAILLGACAGAVPPTHDRVGGPQAWIDAPLSGETLLLDQAPFEVIAHANDPAGLGSIEFAVNGQSMGSSAPSSGDDSHFRNVAFAWTPPAPGDYVLTITAFDSQGNPGPAAAVSVIVSGTDPTSPAVTGTPAPTATATATEVAGACTFTAAINIFCRAGPGQGYEDIDSFTPGQMAPVLGESTDGFFWYVTGPNAGRLCTVPKAERFGAVTGDCSQIPDFTPVPLPTATPTPTATPCVGPDCG
jgi:Bacterial Ig domain